MEDDILETVMMVVGQLRGIADDLQEEDLVMEDKQYNRSKVQRLMEQAGDFLLREYGLIEFAAIEVTDPRVKCLN